MCFPTLLYLTTTSNTIVEYAFWIRDINLPLLWERNGSVHLWKTAKQSILSVTSTEYFDFYLFPLKDLWKLGPEMCWTPGGLCCGEVLPRFLGPNKLQLQLQDPQHSYYREISMGSGGHFSSSNLLVSKIHGLYAHLTPFGMKASCTWKEK